MHGALAVLDGLGSEKGCSESAALSLKEGPYGCTLSIVAVVQRIQY